MIFSTLNIKKKQFESREDEKKRKRQNKSTSTEKQAPLHAREQNKDHENFLEQQYERH